MYGKGYDSYPDVSVNTLKLTLQASALTSQSLFHFKSNVLEQGANTTKHVSLP